jgi:hypothetical protein
MANKKTLQRKKPGYTKAGVAKIVSLGTKQLVTLLDQTQKKKVKAKINRRLSALGYVEPVVEEVVIAEIAELVAEETLQATE